MTCHGCAGHLQQTTDKTVGRRVEKDLVVCLDCKAIEQAKAKHHKTSGHTKDKCDCDDYVFAVDKYLELPPS